MVKPFLAIGLGNPLMGDDGVGPRVARLLASDAALAGRLDVVCGGTDLIRHMDLLPGRERVILIDAAEGGEPGRISVSDDTPSDSGPESAHELSPVRCLQLLRIALPLLDAVRFTWVLVDIGAAELRPSLSPEVEAAVLEAAEAVRRLVG